MYMPKTKKNPIENLVEDLKTAENEITNAVVVKEEGGVDNPVDVKRRELINSSEDGEITHSVKYLKKATETVIEKLYKEMEIKRMEKANQFVTDMLISKFAYMLGGLDAIEDSESLNNELQNDKLLKKDVETIVSQITPFIPLLGIVSGGLTTSKHLFNKYRGKEEEVFVDARPMHT